MFWLDGVMQDVAHSAIACQLLIYIQEPEVMVVFVASLYLPHLATILYKYILEPAGICPNQTHPFSQKNSQDSRCRSLA